MTESLTIKAGAELRRKREERAREQGRNVSDLARDLLKKGLDADT